MLKPTETSKNSNFLRKNCKSFKYLETIAKFQVFGKNCKNFKYLEKIAEIS